ncbi:hypothetical protein ACIBTV_25445 [Micromonospora sp. NPDC049366]|uniref:hypothetical protein n=1 Tax=Micromonospora sp. NPDC049366 TaxID=3364271 RepID=UPI0037B73A61
MANVYDAPATANPDILMPGKQFGVETLDDNEYGVREEDVVIYGTPDTLRSFCEAILSRIPTPTEGTHEERLERAVTDAEPLFWAVINAHFPEVETGDFGPGDAHELVTALEGAVRTWLLYNHPDNQHGEDLTAG